MQQAGKDVGMAQQGVPAGCGFATTWAQVYLLEVVDDFISSMQGRPLDLDIFIHGFGRAGIVGPQRHKQPTPFAWKQQGSSTC